MFEIFGKQDRLWQWDVGQKVCVEELPDGAEVHFSQGRKGTALVTVPYECDGHMVADVPNILLQSGAAVDCYASVGGKTVASSRLSVYRRAKPSDYVYTETEVEDFDGLRRWVEGEVASIPQAAPATSDSLGVVTVGDNLTVTPDGRLSADQGKIVYLSNADFVAAVKQGGRR